MITNFFESALDPSNNWLFVCYLFKRLAAGSLTYLKRFILIEVEVIVGVDLITMC